jgi:hypothetical protein
MKTTIKIFHNGKAADMKFADDGTFVIRKENDTSSFLESYKFSHFECEDKEENTRVIAVFEKRSFISNKTVKVAFVPSGFEWSYGGTYASSKSGHSGDCNGVKLCYYTDTHFSAGGGRVSTETAYYFFAKEGVVEGYVL